MINYRSETALFEFFSETLHFFRVEAAELPAPRVAREDLEGITLLRNCCVYCVVEGFGDGDVDPDSNRKVSLVHGAVAV
jgi:hypothetical protein